MKKTIALLSIVATAVLTGYVYFINTPLPQPTKYSAQTDSTLKTARLVPLKSVVILSPDPDKDDQQAHFQNNAMKLQLKSVSKAFEKSIKYPVYSQPVNENQWDLLNPNAFVKNSRKLSKESDLSASIELSSYILFEDTPIELTVNISDSQQPVHLISYQAEIISQNKVVDTPALKIVSETDSSIVIKGRINTDSSSNWDSDLQIRINLDLNNNTNIFVSSFKYAQKLVELINISNSYVDSTDLVIPLEFEVNESGRYITSANLFSKKTGKPIAHLFTKENLSLSNTRMNLTVHSSLFRDINDSGPYELKNFSIKRLPSKPGDKTGYGYTRIKQANINGFELDRYSDEPYVNLQAQQRLEFLQQLAN